MAKVAVAIPTIRSSGYIFAALNRLKQEIRRLATRHEVALLVCVNGTSDGGKTVHEVKKFMGQADLGFTAQCLDEETGGKNHALDTLTDYARTAGMEIIHFLDDDVILSEGALLTNTDTLLREAPEGGAMLLVGSHFRSIDRSLRSFLQGATITAAMRSWFWHNVFRVPFDSAHDYPAFCSGQCMGLFVKHMPALPDDKTGITDDTYLSNFAAINGRIIKPTTSEVYFNISTDPSEWLKQQIRTYEGIVRARDHFTGREAFIEKLNAWPYCHIKACRIKPTVMTLRRRFFYKIFLGQSDRVSDTARRQGSLEWGTAVSTKVMHGS